MTAAARRKIEGKELLTTIDMFYKTDKEVHPSASTPFKPYNQTISFERGRGRGGHESGDEFIHYLTI